MSCAVETAARLVNTADGLISTAKGLECIRMEGTHQDNTGSLHRAYIALRRALATA